MTLSAHYQCTISMLLIPFQQAISILSACNQHIISLLLTVYRHAINTLSRLSELAISTLSAHSGHATGMLPAHFHHAIDTPATCYQPCHWQSNIILQRSKAPRPRRVSRSVLNFIKTCLLKKEIGQIISLSLDVTSSSWAEVP